MSTREELKKALEEARDFWEDAWDAWDAWDVRDEVKAALIAANAALIAAKAALIAYDKENTK